MQQNPLADNLSIFAFWVGVVGVGGVGGVGDEKGRIGRVPVLLAICFLDEVEKWGLMAIDCGLEIANKPSYIMMRDV